MSQSSFNPKLELLDLPDCEGLSRTGRCTWLCISSCRGELCPFRQSRSDLHAARAAINHRLISLDEQTQAKISRKYYGGKMPWKTQKIEKTLSL
jgi:hypothetical protein